MNASEFAQMLVCTVREDPQISDIHLHGGSGIFVRRSGVMDHIDGLVSDADIVALISEYSGEQISCLLTDNKDADFALTIQDIRFRANGYMRHGGIGLVLRVIASTVPDLSALKLPSIATDIMGRADGLVLVTGPTGSGKSTSLAALINHVNETQTKMIYTIEDPIEFIHHNKLSVISQREVGIHTSAFAVALKAVLRQDPDIILLGELRDFETISLALTAAETGHLVLATLHTRSAADAISRIIDVYPERQQAQAREQLAGSLQMVMTQILVPSQTGGRVAACEVLVNTPAVATHIREAKTAQLVSVMQTNADNGMITMQASLEMLANSGVIEARIIDSIKAK